MLNVKRAEGDSNFVVVGPYGVRSQSSSFVPPERVSQAAPSGKEVAECPSYAGMPSLILSTRNTDSMNIEGALVDASAPVVEHVHHSSSLETVFPDGIYSGPLSAEGNPEGIGSMQFHDGGVYKGNWANGRMHGTGTFDYADGGQYCGEWKKGNIHGMGKFLFADGCVYQGKWRNGKMEGRGEYSFTNDESYVGEWKRNQPEGQGLFIYKSGNKYEGSWSKGKRDGNGTFYYKNGDAYVGEWKADRKNGIGIYRWNQSNEKLAFCLDIKTYVDDEPQEGIRWNANKTHAWRLLGGIEAAEVSLAEASRFKENASTISPYLFMSLMQDF